MADGGRAEGIYNGTFGQVFLVEETVFYRNYESRFSGCGRTTRKDFTSQGWLYVGPKELVEWND